MPPEPAGPDYVASMSNMDADLLMRERRVLEAVASVLRYVFVFVDQVLDDFLADVAAWKGN